MYSSAWKHRNSAPSSTVSAEEHQQLLAVAGACSAWWAMVTVTPEDSRISVLSSGTPQAGMVWNAPPIAARAVGRPAGAVAVPQQRVGHHAVAFAAEPRQRELARVEQRAEERGEEHHLGEDEPHHPHAERGVDLLVVVAARSIRGSRRRTSRTASPASMREADEEHRLAPAGSLIQLASAEHGGEQRDRAEERPAAAVRHVVDGWRRGAWAAWAMAVFRRCCVRSA